jgi:CelD/BcsL family acetyltransferase involved in cellulose biosynthesis
VIMSPNDLPARAEQPAGLLVEVVILPARGDQWPTTPHLEGQDEIPDAWHGLGKLAASVPGWAELARDLGAIFAVPAWALGAHHHMGGGTPLIVTVRDGSRLVGLLPLALRRRCGMPVLGFLGAGPSDYGTVLVDRRGADPQVVVDLLLDAAVESVPPALLDLEQMSDADPALVLVQRWATRRGRSVRCLAQAGTLQEVFRVVDGVPAVPRTRSIRRHGHRTVRLLQAMGEVEILRDLLPDAPAWEDVVRVADECAAVDAGHPSAGQRTHPWVGPSGRLLRDFLYAAPPESRWLAGVRLDGRLVAYSLDLVAPTSVATYFASYHVDVAHCGVGTFLESQTRIRAAEWGAGQLDFLRGLQPYKKRAATVEHTSYRVQILPGQLTGRLLGRAIGVLLAWRQELRKHTRLVAAARRIAGLVTRSRGVPRGRGGMLARRGTERLQDAHVHADGHHAGADSASVSERDGDRGTPRARRRTIPDIRTPRLPRPAPDGDTRA